MRYLYCRGQCRAVAFALACALRTTLRCAARCGLHSLNCISSSAVATPWPVEPIESRANAAHPLLPARSSLLLLWKLCSQQKAEHRSELVELLLRPPVCCYLPLLHPAALSTQTGLLLELLGGLHRHLLTEASCRWRRTAKQKPVEGGAARATLELPLFLGQNGLSQNGYGGNPR